ncbi:MAG: response regulator, partial [Proteobacteria bacterium]|nr:response regulator [Pseudomonadota bacterium]
MEATMRVLCVEDSSAEAERIRRAFEHHAAGIEAGLEFARARTLEQARRCLDDAPGPDLLLLSLRAGDDAGLAFVSELRAGSLALTIVALTDAGDAQVAAAALAAGADDYLARHDDYVDEIPALLHKMRRQIALRSEGRALRAAAERLSRLVMASPSILYSLRLDGDSVASVWISENITRLTGFSVQEAQAPGWWQRQLDPGDREARGDWLRRLVETGVPPQEYRLRSKDGPPTPPHPHLHPPPPPAAQP